MNPLEAETITRIRWEPNGRDTGWCGFVGTMKPWAFQIWHAGTPGSPWRLDSALPGQFGFHVDHPDPDALKRHAGRWLEEFVSSLGAVFADTLRAGIQSERDAQDQLAADHEESGHDWQTERAYGRVEALDGLLATVDRTTAAMAAREKE